MHVRGILAGVLVLAGLAAPAVTVAAPAADARPVALQRYTCNGLDWSGKPLRPVTFQIRGNEYRAAHRAQAAWRGVARFATIVCRPS